MIVSICSQLCLYLSFIIIFPKKDKVSTFNHFFTRLSLALEIELNRDAGVNSNSKKTLPYAMQPAGDIWIFEGINSAGAELPVSGLFTDIRDVAI